MSQTKFSVFEPKYHEDYDFKLWNYLEDLYIGSSRWLEITDSGFYPTPRTGFYLPRHPGENSQNWISRINATFYDDLFAKALRRFVDLIFRSGVAFSGEFPEFAANYSTLSLEGVGGDAFLAAIALDAMLYGHCFILIDYPVNSATHYADYLSKNFHPYFVKILPQNLTNWESRLVDGKRVFTRAEVRNFRKGKIEYYVYEPGVWTRYQEIEPFDGSAFAIASQGENPLEIVPIVPVYGGYSQRFAVSLPPLKSLADKSRTLYQLTSDHYRKVSLCCHPVPVLKDLMRSEEEALEIGPNSFINLRDPAGSFNWAEPLATSLIQSRTDIKDLRSQISDELANYLLTPSQRQSATASQLLTSPLEASLANFIRSFVLGINDAIAVYGLYLGLRIDYKIELEYDVFPNALKDSQSALAISTLYEAGLISRAAALESLNDLGFFYKGFDLKGELLSKNDTV